MTQQSPLSEVSARTGRRRGPTKGDRREAALLDAAAELLATRPFSSIKIDELTAQTGVNRSTFYFYFKSRDDLLRALIEDVADELYEADAIWIDEDGNDPPFDTLVKAATKDLQLWRRHGAVLRAAVAARHTDSDIGQYWGEIEEGFIAAAAQRIERERTAGRSPAGPPSATDLARALGAMMQRTHLEASKEVSSDERDAEIALTVATIWHRTIYPAGLSED